MVQAISRRSGAEKSGLKTLLGSWADNLPVCTLPQERRVIFPTSLATFFFLSPSHKCSEFCLLKQVTKPQHTERSSSGNIVGLGERNTTYIFVTSNILILV